ncbi:MAG TPA: class I SAM-dependent methyltransferase [Candidatus Xenobia bacterium]|jgi:SAM-dependent methyltransferase
MQVPASATHSSVHSVERSACAACGATHLFPFLDLGDMPPANALLKRPDQEENSFPLGLVSCQECHLIQLTHLVPSELLFKGYVYFSSISQTMAAHFAEMAGEIEDRFVPENGLVVEIGSNDGILLHNLVGHPVRILGVDPAETAAAAARERGVPTVVDFFNTAVAQRIRDEHGPASAILGNNVLAHIPNLQETIRACAVLAADDGVLVFEFPYVVDFLLQGEFDTVYHEHFYYLGLGPLERLLRQHGFRIFEARRMSVHGGSIRVFASRRTSPRTEHHQVGELGELERSLELANPDRLKAFGQHAEKVRSELNAMVDDLRQQGKRVVGYTAPAKGNVLLNYCKLGPDRIDYLADATPAKQGLYSPGMHIPIQSPEHFQQDRPDYAVLLAWNHQAEVMRREQLWHELGGKFIVPIPNPHIV